MFSKRANLEDLIKIGNNDKTYQPNMAVTATAAQMLHKGKVCVMRGSRLRGILFLWERGILHSLPSCMKSLSSRKSAHFPLISKEKVLHQTMEELSAQEIRTVFLPTRESLIIQMHPSVGILTGNKTKC